MLMKLRWPKHVHMLRGSHESSEECAENTFFDANHYRLQCMDAYNDRKICALFSQIFDYMPIAAIVNGRRNKIFCCHGGISQWMTSRDAIRTIKRPIVLYSMSVLQSCLFTDLLWADPAPRQKICLFNNYAVIFTVYDSEEPYSEESFQAPFQVSPRRCSYTFNADGLNAALQHINCEALLRGNEDTENGICVNFPNKCITVHTTNSQAPSHVRGAYLTIAKRNDRLDIDCATHSLILNSVQQIQKAEYAKVMTDFVYSFKKLKYEEYFRRLSRKNLVEHVIVNTVAEAHYVTPDTMRTWLSTYAIREMGYLPAFYGSVKNSVWDYATYFPVLYDAVKGLRSTFRMSVLPSTFDLPVFYQDWPHEPFENKKPKEQDIQSRIKSLSHVWEPFAERH
uniref:SER_THR_PHOSPHATASE domain-containing protein n=1 Tax=Syphacia muris TaxID=451379 RepID=A0A0N5AMR7_9BILA